MVGRNERIIFLIIIIFLGCIKTSEKFTYDDVYVKFSIFGGSSASDWHRTEYILENNKISYIQIFKNGTVYYSDSGSVTDDEFKQLGREYVSLGIFKMQDRFERTDLMGPYPDAVLNVSIDGKRKNILIQPYTEDFSSGSIQKMVFNLKRLAQNLQKTT